MINLSRGRLILYIVLLIVASVLTTISFYKHSYVYSFLGIAAATYVVKLIYNIYLESIKKVTFMFNAIDCDDYNFSFPEKSSNDVNNLFNSSLNRIKEIMVNAKIRAAEREKYYELIMNSIRTGIVTISDNGNVYQINSEALRIFGLERLTHIRQLAYINEKVSETMLNMGSGENSQVRFFNERGEVALSLTASNFIYDNKKLKIITVNDINNALDQNQVESWSKLTRVLTHEIMNSLAPITSLSDSLLHINSNGNKEVSQGLETISTTSKSLISFVESYRKFTRIQTPNCTPFSLKQTLERVASLICTNRIRVFIDVAPEETLLYADEDLIVQVLVNILKNAEHAALSSSTPEISIQSHIDSDEKVVVNISNSGPAIPKDIAEDIFTPFFTTKSEGSGIGLSISKQIMHLHNGTIKLTSNQNGKVTFTLYFN